MSGNGMMTLDGAKEVEQAFKMLGDKASKRILRSAAQAGATDMRKSIIRSAPKSNVVRSKLKNAWKYDYLKKHLRQQIKTSVVKSIESDVKILVHTGDAFWGRFVEKGTKRGIDAQHWMKKAFDAAEPSVRAAIEKKLIDAIIREANK